MNDRLQLPSAPDAERSVLGAILNDNLAYYEYQSEIGPEYFSLDSHRRIILTIDEVIKSGKVADLITVIDALRDSRQLEAVGGSGYVAGLTDGVIHGQSVKSHCGVIRDKGNLRSLINTCNNAIARALEGEQVPDIVSSIQNTLLDIEAGSQRKYALPIGEVIPETLKELERESAEGYSGLTTTIPLLDEATGGMRSEELWILGALPNRGKTPFAMQILIENAKRGVPGLMFSLEMSRSQWGRRTLASESTISAWQLRNARFLGEHDWLELSRAGGELMELPIYVDDAASITISELIARARLAIRRQGVRLVVVDYLMLIDAPGKDLRYQANAISKAFRILAKSEHVSVLLLSQFKRPANINERPNSSWYKESGNIEADAHVGLAIHRPIDTDTQEFSGKDEIIITKSRNGSIGSIPVYLNEKRLKFYAGERQ